MTRVFISYAHTPSDTWLAEHLEYWLYLQGISGWRDKTGMVPGDRHERVIDEQIARADAAVFLVSPEWKHRDWTKWELERVAAHDPTGDRIARIAVFRVPVDQLPQGPPPALVSFHGIHWQDGVHDKRACFWQLLHGIDPDPNRSLGLEHTWAEKGASLVPDIPREPGAPVPVPIVKSKPRRSEKPSIECGRAKEWLMVQQMYPVALHQISIVAAPRYEAHETFVARIEKKLIDSAPPPVKRITWPTLPLNREDFLDCLATALSPRGAEASADELPQLLERLLADANAILLHDVIDHYSEGLIRYYTEWLPELLPKNPEAHRLKCVQPVAWSPSNGAMRLGKRLAAALKLRGLSERFCARDERLAIQFIERLGAAQAVKSVPIGLSPIDEEDVLAFCTTHDIKGARREALLVRTRRGPRIRTSADVLHAMDQYFEDEKKAAAAAGEAR